MNDLRQFKAYAAYMSGIGWMVERSSKGVFAYIKKMPLLPVSVMKVQRVDEKDLDFEWLRSISKKHRAIMSYVELARNSSTGVDATLLKQGFRANRSGMLPTKSLVVDISQSEEVLLGCMKSKTRYNIGLASRKQLIAKVVSGTELAGNEQLFREVYSLLKLNARRVGWMGMSEKWLRAQMKAFGADMYCVMAMLGDELLAVTVILTADGVAYYEHNGSSEQGRPLMAPTWCVWQGMREARKRKLRYFDFDGIFDERYPLKRWKGFSRFKLGFGGEKVMYPPAYSKWLPWRYNVVE